MTSQPARTTATPSSTNRSANKRRLHSERPSGASEQASRISSASCSPSSLWPYSRSGLLRDPDSCVRRCLSTSSRKSVHAAIGQCLRPPPGPRRSGYRSSIGPGWSFWPFVDPGWSFSSTFNKTRARVSLRAGRFPRPMRSRLMRSRRCSRSSEGAPQKSVQLDIFWQAWHSERHVMRPTRRNLSHPI